MKAIGIDTEGILALRDCPEPRPARREVLVETQTVGICATDREMVRTNQVYTIPSGEDYLILGHEGLGRIIEKGSDVDEFAVGDLVVPVAYRRCEPMHALCRVDMCPYGQDRRRGINTHGFFSENFVETPEYLLSVPSELSELAVLLEPLTVTLKGFTEAQAILSRWEGMPCFYRPDDRQRSVLVVGAGPSASSQSLPQELTAGEQSASTLFRENLQKRSLFSTSALITSTQPSDRPTRYGRNSANSISC